MTLLESSHNMYQDTIWQWQQRELEADGRAKAKMREALGESLQASSSLDDSLSGPARHQPQASDATWRGGEGCRASGGGAGLARGTSLPVCGVGAAARAGKALPRSVSAVMAVREAASAKGPAPLSLPSLA